MLKPTKNQYIRILEDNPRLCAKGMSNDVQKIFQANRKSLEASYDAFLICCDWFSNLSLRERAAIYSLNSFELKHQIESRYGQFIPHGSVLAAAIFLDIELCPDSGEPKTRQASNSD
jgi:hypothetical protein